MNKPSDPHEKKIFSRDLLIGMGEFSARKNYYTELQQRIAELEKVQASLVESEQRYRLAVEAASDAIWDWDIEKNTWSISAQWAEKLGLPVAPGSADAPLVAIDDFSQVWQECIHPRDRRRWKILLAEHLAGNSDVFGIECRYLVPKGRQIWLSAKGKAIRNESGEPVRMIGSYADITGRKQQEERIRHMAYHDGLTDLPNAASLHKRLIDFVSVKARDVRPGALFLLNIDNFKVVNDTWGYSCGDALLVGIADRLAQHLSAAGMVVRLSGDEFAFLVEVADPAAIDAWAGKIFGLFDKPIQVHGNEIFVSSSMGIVLFRADASVDAIMANATTALDYAKKAGKKTWRLFREEMQQAVVRRLQLESELEQALALNQFVVYYQPQVSIFSGRIAGMEALVRWQHPQKGLIQPMEFIPLAEETGLIVPLGEFVARSACRFGNLLRRNHGVEIRMAVNISARQLMQDDFLPRLCRILREEDYPPECFELEITESILLESLAENIQKLRELRSLGIHIALDDFGTGYSSLTYLSQLPADVLKIDRSFVQELGSDENGAAIIGMIVRLAHQLKLQVVAEGIETKEQLGCMRALKCDYLQGYLASRPLPSSQILALYESRQGKLSL